MTVFDWIIIALMLFFTVKSVVRGAIRELSSLLALAAAAVAAFRYHGMLLPLVQQHLSSPLAQTLAAGSIAFLAVYVCVLCAGWLIALVLHSLHLGFFDRSAGVAIGLVKGYLFVCCAVCIVLLLPNGTAVARQSRLAVYCLPALRQALPYVPEPLRGRVREGTAALTAPAVQPAPGRRAPAAG